MEFIEYIKKCLNEERGNTPVDDLLKDMAIDIKNLEEKKTLENITFYIYSVACYECKRAYDEFRRQYHVYCVDNNLREEKMPL